MITIDKYPVKDVTQYDTFEHALRKANEFLKSNPNAQSIEILSKVNGALLKKVK
jgi:ASC-1-like (ASCH) protein